MNAFGNVSLLAALALPLVACQSNEQPKPPSTCTELLETEGLTAEGLYTLYREHDALLPWLGYCVHTSADATAPEGYREFLPLPHALEASNESGVLTSADQRVTSFAMLPIDPVTFDLTTTELRFGRSTPVDANLSYATAVANGSAAWANVDLRGTAFAVLPEQFDVTGKASVSMTDHDQVVEIEASSDGAVTPRQGLIMLRYIGTVPPPDQAAAAEAGVEVTPQP